MKPIVRHSMSVVVFLLLLIQCYLPAQAQIGESFRISGEMSNGADDVSRNYIISPDGRFVVYMVNADLYSVPINGGTPTQLNRISSSLNNRVFSFKVSNNSQRVVYNGISGSSGGNEIFSVPIVGGTTVALSADIGQNSAVVSDVFQLSADSQTVVYVAAQDATVDLTLDAFSVPINGGSSVKLNVELFGDSSVGTEIQISPDSQRVIYFADENFVGTQELFSVSIAGGNSVKLNPDLARGRFIVIPQISADSQRVIYNSDQDSANIFELYSVPINGGTAIRLNSDLVSGGNVGFFSITPDSQTVVYQADQDINDVSELFRVPIAGGMPIKINPNLVSGRSIPLSDGFQVSGDGQHVIYRADQDTENIIELFSVPLSGGTPTKLNALFFGGGDGVTSFQISPDSNRVVFTGFIFGTIPLLSSALITGGSRVSLTNGLSLGENSLSFEISSDSQRVIYVNDLDVDNVNELYSTPISGGAVTQLNSPLPFSSDVDDFSISPTGEFVVYRADQNIFDQLELFAHRLREADAPNINELCFPIVASNGNVAVICL